MDEMRNGYQPEIGTEQGPPPKTDYLDSLVDKVCYSSSALDNSERSELLSKDDIDCLLNNGKKEIIIDNFLNANIEASVNGKGLYDVSIFNEYWNLDYRDVKLRIVLEVDR